MTQFVGVAQFVGLVLFVSLTYIRVPIEIQKHNSMIFPWFSMINNAISMTI